MSKVRVGHEDLFIAHLIYADNIREKYHFKFNRKCAINSSDTKRIGGRKKAYPMNLTAQIVVPLDYASRTQQRIQIHYALIINQSITDLLINIVSEINKFIDTLYPSVFL
jgi:hypothetical protein